MPNRDKVFDLGGDVQATVVSVDGNGGTISVPSASQAGSGPQVKVLQDFGYWAPPWQPQPAASTVILINMLPKEKEKEERQPSNVFDRL